MFDERLISQSPIERATRITILHRLLWHGAEPVFVGYEISRMRPRKMTDSELEDIAAIVGLPFEIVREEEAKILAAVD